MQPKVKASIGKAKATILPCRFAHWPNHRELLSAESMQTKRGKTQSRVDKETEQLSQQIAEQVNRAFEKLEAVDSALSGDEDAKV